MADVTLATLMYRVASKIGDVKKLKATDNAVSAVTFVDEQRVNSERLFWTGGEIFFLDDDHFGQWGTITSSTELGSIVFTPAVTGGNIQQASEAYVFNVVASKGFGVEQYRDMVLNAIADLRGRLLVPLSAAVAGVYSEIDGQFLVPEALSEIYAVDYLGRDGEYRAIKPSIGRRRDGWSALGSGGIVFLEGGAGGTANARALRVRGYGEITAPTLYSDTVPEPVQPIIELAAFSLMRSGIDRDNKYPILFRPSEDQMMKAIRSYLPDREAYTERVR